MFVELPMASPGSTKKGRVRQHFSCNILDMAGLEDNLDRIYLLTFEGRLSEKFRKYFRHFTLPTSGEKCSPIYKHILNKYISFNIQYSVNSNLTENVYN